MKRTTAIRTNPPIYDERYRVVCPIESDCGAFEEQNCTCFECGVHEHIVKLAAYEDTGYTPEEIAVVMALAEKMNVCDLVRENLRIANRLRHTEVEIAALKAEYRVGVNAGADAIRQLKSDNERLKVERDALIKAVAYCGSCALFGKPTPDGMGVCKKNPACWKTVSPDDYRPECFNYTGLEESTCG